MDNQSWIRSRNWDSFWILSGLWIFPLFYLLFSILGENVGFYFTATIFLIIRLVHSNFTTYLCVFSKPYRKVAMNDKKRFFFGPLIFVVIFSLFLLLPESIIPMRFEERLALYFFTEFLYSLVHYGYQHFGMVSIYRTNQKQKVSSLHFTLEKIFCLIVAGVVLMGVKISNFYDIGFSSFSYSKFLFTKQLNWNQICISATTVLYIVLMGFEFKLKNRSYPKMLYLTSILVLNISLTQSSFLVAWALLDMQHFLVMYGLGTHMLSNAKESEEPLLEARPKTYFYRYIFFFMMASIAITLLHFHFNASGVVSKKYHLVLGGFLPQSLSGSFAQRVGFTILLGVSVCHWYYDRLVFRFSDPSVGPVTRSLIFGNGSKMETK